MPNAVSTISIRPVYPVRKASIIAGVGYIFLFVLAIFANFNVREGLIVSGNAMETAANVIEFEGLFRIGLLSFLVIFLLDVFVAWALYVVFREVERDLSLLAAWLRLVYTVLLGVALIFFFQALQYLSGDEFLNVMADNVLHAHALIALNTFNSAWLIGLTAFGLHLIVLGYLIVRSEIAPKALGWVLVVSGTIYIGDTTAHSLLTNYTDYEALIVAIVAGPAILAEGWFGFWLLLKGGKQNRIT